MIKLLSIDIQNFSGIATAHYNFKDNTEIVSASGTGKSSIYNAYLFALGFDVEFEPQIDGNRIANVNTCVKAYISKNNLTYEICRENTQKFKIVDGVQKFLGNNLKYSIDGTELTYTRFKEKISEIYETDYMTLELLTNINLFMSESTKWNKNTRRKFLYKIFDLENKIKELQLLPKYTVLKGLDEIEIKKYLNNCKTAIDNGLNKNNILLEERQKSLAEINAIDFNALECQKDELQKELDILNTSESENYLKNSILNKIGEIQNNITLAKNENNKRLMKKTDDENTCRRAINMINGDIEYQQKLLKSYESDLEILEIDLIEENCKQLDNSSYFCEMCGQKLPENKISEIVDNFNSNKNKKVQQMTYDIEYQKKNIESARVKLQECINQKETKLNELKEIQNRTIDLIDTDCYLTELTELNNQLNSLSNNDLSDKKNELKNKIRYIDSELSKQEIKNYDEKRIAELIADNISLTEQEQDRILKLEALKDFSKEKMKLVNEQVNIHFEKVTFNFFHYQSANATNPYEDVCEAMLDNVEYYNMSSGQKVKANYYIGKSLRAILNLDIPQFIDDTVLSDFQEYGNTYQTIYLVTDNNVNIGFRLIKNVYTEKDCVNNTEAK